VVLAWARARQAGEVGAAAPPTDVDTTGSSPEHDPQAATTAPDDWRQNPYVQLEGGFLAGVSLGLVPMGGVGQQLADAGEVLPHGTPEARLGLAVGQIVGGIALTVGGFTGEVLGGAATVTGIGVAVGVPAMMVSTTLVVGGAGNIAAGIRGLMTTGSGRSGPQGPAPGAQGEARFPEKPGQTRHIFRDAPGHLADTPANRALLKGVADDASTTLGTDRFGNVWSARTLEDGTQVWVQTRNGVIQNGGLNKTPRVFNSETGLSGP
jgi:hypothetical protein